MNRFSRQIGSITDELTKVMDRIDEQEFDDFLEAVQNARRIALHGVGREGLMMRALAMRLYHLGYDVSVVGDMTTPHLGSGDLLILSAGPGFFHTVDGLRQVAQQAGAKAVCITAEPNGKTPAACDAKVVLPAQTMASDQGSSASSILPMGSLYELAEFVFGEIVVLELLKRIGRTLGETRDRHTNLE